MQLQLWYNQFGFDALEPYFDGPGHMRAAAGSTYLPQTQPLLPTASLSITVQQPARFDARRDSALQGNYTHYQWQREVNGDWQTVAGATAATYALAAAAPADAGRYRCQATNDWVTGLTLYSRVYVLTVDELEAGPRNLPDDANQGMALAQPHAPADSAATAPVDMNYVRTWVPRVALRHASNQASPGQCTATGQILREEWDNAPGTEVSQIPLTSVPGSFSYLTALEGPTNCGDNYGDRIRGYLCPPQTGNYTFWIAGDDTSELWVLLNK